MGVSIASLKEHLLDGTRDCIRPPLDRFRHPWLAPMPLSPVAKRYLDRRRERPNDARLEDDRFMQGDYSLGLFHHDASEAAIELLQHDEFLEPVAGSLLCFLENAEPGGRVHRVELCHRVCEPSTAKPVIAQFAQRVCVAMGEFGLEWIERNRVYQKVTGFLDFIERNYSGHHGLILTPSSVDSGFDNDVLTFGAPHSSVEAPDTNTFMILEYAAASALASALGLGSEADRFEAKAARLRELMNRLLWHEDDNGGFYRSLRWDAGARDLESDVVGFRGPNGRVRPLESWTSLLPLYAGVPSSQMAERIFQRLLDPEWYWGEAGVRTLPRASEFFSQAPRALYFDSTRGAMGTLSNWAGPVWVLSNYYLSKGLDRYGRRREAQELAGKTLRTLTEGLSREGRLCECYDDEGRGLWPREGTFISWNVLVLSLWDEFLRGKNRN